ncbi:acyl-CoA carboxylase subunit epsilon [Streptomyces olivochromogenes]|uniref:acyl-CoA carboxylase subunit epsilon n=1 Tax=Streptomyces olivochromogenes TaxID=1963 RepID=UPI0035B0A7ED|nr:acyl-CoA carboxylase subunit epsilon [Streptomyces olivochromogenes]
MSDAEDHPIRVVRGDPDPEQLAAVTVVLLALLRGTEPTTSPRPLSTGWVQPTHRLPGSWSTS